MNKIQNNYAVAKAYYETIDESIKDYEKQWIIDNDIKRLDGSTPDSLWQLCLDDEESMFLDYSERLDSDNGYQQLMDEKRIAKKLLHESEESLIDFGLSIAPTGIRETLEKGRSNLRIREKLIDLAFRLDARTIKAAR